jgi:hypothetical protein
MSRDERPTKGKARFHLNHIGVEHEFGVALVNLSDGALAQPVRTVPGPERLPEGAPRASDSQVEVLSAAGWKRTALLPLGHEQPGFAGTRLASVDLTGLRPGRYVLRYRGECSAPVLVERNVLLRHTLDAVLGYFRGQRAASPWNDRDRFLPVYGRPEVTVDVHGGWFDASGDVSKYLTHLSYSNFLNPQQTPIVVWGLLEHLERLDGRHAPGMRERIVDEAKHGARFLARMQAPEGYFYQTVFDQWSKDLDRRVVCAYARQTGELLGELEAGYRQGGGVTIAALARAGRLLGRPEFITAAEAGFRHLELNNARYLGDGKENVLDDYCALLAAVELAATGDDYYADAAWTRAKSLMARTRADGPHPGWLQSDDGDRPYYHAAEAGLPALALLRMAEVVPFRRDELVTAAARLLDFELWVTGEVPNPFGYARQYVADVHGAKRTSFFIPHENETGYWWQGENARLASLAAAAGKLAGMLEGDPGRSGRLRGYAYDQLDWICGKNPFDACMLHGFGRNNGDYLVEWPNAVGGICNGITSGFEDETDVDFGRPDVVGDHSWRWHEQWIPHAAWYLIALGELAT